MAHSGKAKAGASDPINLRPTASQYCQHTYKQSKGNCIVGIDPSKVNYTLLISKEHQGSKPSREMTQDASSTKIDGHTDGKSDQHVENSCAKNVSPQEPSCASDDPSVAGLVRVTWMPKGDFQRSVCRMACKERPPDHQGERFVTVPPWTVSKMRKIEQSPNREDYGHWNNQKSPADLPDRKGNLLCGRPAIHHFRKIC
jgi:hypothetical protein